LIYKIRNSCYEVQYLICKQDIPADDRGMHLIEKHGLTATVATVVVFWKMRSYS
jgi:hypothetical protein